MDACESSSAAGYGAPEALYQYLWRSMALGRSFYLEDGRRLNVVSPGVLNPNAGPDFCCARINIDGSEWAGNVEIHVKASDWHRHGHDADEAYDSVLLHVVAEADVQIFRRDGSPIPTLRFRPGDSMFNLMEEWRQSKDNIRCRKNLGCIPPLHVADWLETLSVERVAEKADRVLEECAHLDGDWEQTCFVILARGLGFGLNGLPMEMLARSLPLKYLHHHSDNLFQLEALIFGQAGLLDMSQRIFNEYYQALCREYYFLLKKYGLRPINASIWKFARTRPQNFPHRRLSLLAKACQGGFSLSRKIEDANFDIDLYEEIFNWRFNRFWRYHYTFDSDEYYISDSLGAPSVNLLIINVVVPLLYASAKRRGDYEKGERVADILRQIPEERNVYVRQWRSAGLKITDAMRSQAVLQLSKTRCEPGRCLDCRFGHGLISLAANEELPGYGEHAPDENRIFK